MRRYRPGSVLVVAILQIAFGALNLLEKLCGLGFQLAGGNKIFAPPGSPQAAQQPDVEGFLREKLPYYDAMRYGGMALGLVVGTVMIVSGVGLLKMRRWGRRMTIGYACYSILRTILSIVFAFIVAVPLMREFVARELEKPNLPAPQAMALKWMDTSFTIATYVPLLRSLSYPIVVLIVMFLPHVRAEFRAERVAAVEEDEGEEADGLPDEADEADTPREQDGDSGAVKNPDAPAP